MPVLDPDQLNDWITKTLTKNLVIECTSATQIVIKANSVVGADDGSIVMEASGDITVDITGSGVNGLDTGSEASDTWYYIYMIYNPTTETVSGLLSTSATSPTMPSGYTKKRLVGAVRNGGSSHFRQFVQNSDYVQYIDNLTLLNTASPSTVWVTLDPQVYVPTSLSGVANLLGGARNDGTQDLLVRISPKELSGGSASGVSFVMSDYSSAQLTWWYNNAMFGLSSGGKLSYRASQASGYLSIFVTGYRLTKL